jgi:hypothetical protein
MATNATWTVVFEDRCVIKNTGAEAGTGYIIDDAAFWATTAFQNIWAIQSGTSNSSDEVEHRDGTAHCSLADEGIEMSQFITRDNLRIEDPEGEDPPVFRDETEAEKIARLGARPTSYSS